MKILLAECMQEISSFNPVPSEYSNFTVRRGQARREPHTFDEWADKNFNIDAPGSTSADLRSLGHTICSRPMYPLNPT